VISLHAFADETDAAADRLGAALGVRPQRIVIHRFPGGETQPRVTQATARAILYRSLHDPNAKLVDTLLAADALRRAGSGWVALVSPYLPYMRQDAVFHAGEPLSRDVIVPLIAAHFDAVVVVDPHLHRTASLSQIAPQTRWIVVGAAAAIAAGLRTTKPGPFDVVVGPDAEAAPWARAVAEAMGVPFWTFEKTRFGDRNVVVVPPGDAAAAGRRVLLVDDICTTGRTLAQAARALRALGATRVEAAVTHALFSASDAGALVEAGIERIRSCDGCPHPSNAFRLAGPIVSALHEEAIA
jgi:ribose-phosphate pyrophosphokinase